MKELNFKNSEFEKRISRVEGIVGLRSMLHVERDGKGGLIFYSGKDVYRHYKPTPTGAKLHNVDSGVIEVMGPYGSGKSSMDVADIVMSAMDMPACDDGVRRSLELVVRNTSGELETTTLKTWLHWCGCLGEICSHKKPVMTYEHKFNDPDGQIELELVFLGLDRPDDIRKLKSLEASHAWLNEASELPSAVLSHVKARTGRYPAKKILSGSFRPKVRLDTNPPDTDHYLYKLFEEEKPKKHFLFKQPPGLRVNEDNDWETNPEAENLGALPENYYLDFSLGQTKEFIKVYCLGQYGAVLDGKKVHPNYNDDIHSVDNIEFDKSWPVYIGWDFGLTPACLLAQFINGQRRDIKEFTTERMGLRELAEMIVKPYLSEHLDGVSMISRGDPSGGDGKDPLHYIHVLNELGIPTAPARTNKIGPRLDAINFYLNRLVDGHPGYIISRKGCPQLRKGFLGKYRYKRLAVIGQEKYRDEPEKLHPWSDIQDCSQYIGLEMMGCIGKTSNDDLARKLYQEMNDLNMEQF
jgi:hypothetical protein